MIQFQNNHKRQKPGHQVLFKEILPLRSWYSRQLPTSVGKKLVQRVKEKAKVRKG